MIERETIMVATPVGGWHQPWPRVAEIAKVIGPEHWTLVGGLMVQLHAIQAGITTLRPTTDIDMAVHIETGRGRASDIAAALEGLGYELRPSIDGKNTMAHRFVRGADAVDVAEPEQVDVVTAEHSAPAIAEKLRGYDMVRIEGGTQALRRTVHANLTIEGEQVTISVPNVYGALILKSAAHLTDSRDKHRHLTDAVILLACLEDPFAETEKEAYGSDGKRLRYLASQLDDEADAWMALQDSSRARAALRILQRPASATQNDDLA